MKAADRPRRRATLALGRRVPLPLVVGAALAFQAGAAQAIDEIPETMTFEALDPILMQTVNEQLPEQRQVNAEFLNPSFTPFVTLNQDAQIFSTFVNEGAGYRNSLGYFSFSSGAFDGLSKASVDLDGSGVVSLDELSYVNSVEIGYVFPNASKVGAGGRLTAGDTVAIGDGTIFAAGDNVGFYLNQNAWNGSDIRSTQASSSDETQVMYSLDFLNPEAPAVATMATDPTASSSRHAAMMFADASGTEIILGFEDLNRVDNRANDFNYRTDDDFNDAVFIVFSNPFDAIADSNVFVAPAPRLEGLASPLSGLVLVLGGVWVFRRQRGAATTERVAQS